MTQKNKKKPKEPKSKKSELEELSRQIESLQKEKDELFGKLQRVGADYANFQKRVPKQIADTVAYEKEKIIKTLLPALDNLEHTLQNAHSAEDVDVLIKGIQIVYDQVLDTLKSHGVEQIKAAGEKFEPALHEAMMQRYEPEEEENIVLEEFQRGYKLNGRVIRPSKVVVNKPSSEQEAPQQEDTEQEQKADQSTDAE
jgi:molecular chaperone GrpE